MYDPVLGRMLSPDNYIQELTSTQSYNRYSYAFNNPLAYTDPSGHLVFWDNVILGAFTGAYNLLSNLGNIKSFEQGLGFFGVGFASGFVAGYGQIALSGAILSGGNAALGGASFDQIVTNASLGAVTSIAGSTLATAIAPMVSPIIPQVASPLVRSAATNMITGAAVGGTLGGIGSAISGRNFWGGVGSGAATGAAGGLGVGLAKGFVDARRWGVSPWTGKTLTQYATTEFPNINTGDFGGGNRYSIELPSYRNSAAKTGTQGGLNLFKFGKPTTTTAEGWKTGDRMLKMYDQGSPKLNWKQNSGFLRREMHSGNPIFDSYRYPNGQQIPTGGFLNAERKLLESRGWIYNPSTGAYHLP
ncbi:hypothetical protein GCM10023091_20670 [Ravibacter arvi]|uniref:RHS repeat-associated core domain-containing protein n=2 Tax=Ravibacter arvi TaxID=2051041 RepID=A0ABP8LWU9_9BACT